ncbi:MAG TPA: hypothetical protein VEH52_07935 [Gaiellaceae bacterium]|jgi:hypothetical protein|nr:hypothetical protein [Gaiellaceae bacterium]
MKGFAALLAVAVIGGLLYATTAVGGQQASPTAAQFNALKRTVAAMAKKQKADEKTLTGLVTVVGGCLHGAVPVARYQGYEYVQTDGTTIQTTALDVAGTGDTPQAYLLDVGSVCAQAIASAGGALSLHHLHYLDLKSAGR